MIDPTPTSDATFNEADHPRGNPENAGQFTKKDSGVSTARHTQSPKKQHVFSFRIGGVNSIQETVFITAPTFKGACYQALLKAANGRKKYFEQTWARPLATKNGPDMTRFGIIEGDKFNLNGNLDRADQILSASSLEGRGGDKGTPDNQRSGAVPSGVHSHGSQDPSEPHKVQGGSSEGATTAGGRHQTPSNQFGDNNSSKGDSDPGRPSSKSSNLPTQGSTAFSGSGVATGTVYQPTLGLDSVISQKPHYAEDSKYQPKKHYFRELIRSLRGMTGEKNPPDIPAHRAEMKPVLGEYTRARVSERMPSNPNLAGSSMSPKEVREMVKKSCDLIKTVPHGKKLKGVETRVKRLFENTNTTKDTLKRYLMGKCGLKEYQANRIIEDQSIKYKANAHLEELKRQGVKTVRWCVGDCKEHRPSHLAPWPYGLNGCVFPIGEPPTDPATGRKIYPGDEIQCHCYLEAVE